MSEQQQDGRPVVEAWGVRGVDRFGESWLETTNYRDEAARWDVDFPSHSPGTRTTVVPLIAADRLTDEALVGSVTDSVYGYDSDEHDVVTAVLAALRTHLEQTGADA